MNVLIQLPYGGDWIMPSMIESVAATDNSVVIHMQDGAHHVVKCSLVGEAKPLRDKFAAEINAALSVQPPRINADSYAVAPLARWHYPAAGELAPKGAIVQLLTVGGTQVQGIWRDSGAYIAWAPNLKRDRALEAHHGLSTPEGKTNEDLRDQVRR